MTLSVVNDRRKPSEMEVEMTADQASFMDRVTVRHPRTFSRQRPLRSQRSAHRFRRITGAREGLTQLVRALKDHENALATVAPRRQAA